MIEMIRYDGLASLKRADLKISEKDESEIQKRAKAELALLDELEAKKPGSIDILSRRGGYIDIILTP